MAKAAAPPPKPAAKPARAKREPSDLALAVRAVNQLKRAHATRERWYGRINALDAKIEELTETAQSRMEAVNKILEGTPVSTGGA